MDDRVALRLGVLRLARQRRNLRESAWAAARLRLTGVRLEPADARFAHDALVRFGRAIRVSRARRGHETGHELPVLTFLAAKAPWRPRVRVRALIAVAIVAALITALLLFRLPAGTADQGISSGGAPGGADARPTASPLRGRSQLIAVAVPTPAATVAPSSNPQGGAPGSTGAGTGPGSGGGVILPTPPPTMMTLSIFVSDANTKIGLPGVCVIDGSTTCVNAPLTDSHGNATMHLTIGQLWHLEFKRAGYNTQEVDVFSNVASNSIAVSLTPTR